MASKDSWASSLYGLPYPIYFYYLNSQYIKANPDLSIPLGNCPALLSVQFAPYLIESDFNISEKYYDTERFGKVDEMRPTIGGTISVFRINSIKEESRVQELKIINTYPKFNKQIGGKRYWGNESKIFQYPYAFAMLTDGISPPLQIKYHLAPQPRMTVKVRSTLSDRCSYGLFIEGYKGDSAGQTEAIVSGDIHELPCSSSAYNQWYASSKNSTAQQVQNTINQAFLTSSQASQMSNVLNQNSIANQGLNQIGGGLGMIGSALSGNIGGVLTGGTNVIGAGMRGQQERGINNLNAEFARQQASLDKKSSIATAMAQVKDLQNTPATMISMGSDFIYGYNKQGSSLKLFRYGLTTEFATKLGDYFAMYGYKQNRLLDLNLHINSRHFYNYIKTIGCNLSSNAISNEDIESFKSIFDNGVTIWHMDNTNVVPGSYEYDNYEVD